MYGKLHSTVSQHLCKEYLTVVKFKKNTDLTPDKIMNVLIDDEKMKSNTLENA